ncbi:MAG: thioredoxin family protein [Burkholderiaceae bacterium]|jgi:thioredoxin-like negative regulator of GroEL|nr:thioredoxin family protein [Burkholderiaceae bacterium]
MTLAWQLLAGADPHRFIDALPGRVLLMFGSRACGTCRAAQARVPSLAEGRVDALVYIDAEVQTALVREYEVFHLPAMFLFRAGRYHAVLHAPLMPTEFGQAIDAALAGPAQEAP